MADKTPTPAIDEIRSCNRTLLAFMRENQAVVDKYLDLATKLEKCVEKNKPAIRPLKGAPGTTTVAIDDEEMKILVLAPADEAVVSVEVAEATWSQRALQVAICKTIDPKVVAKLVETGVLPKEKADAATRFEPSKREPTVRITFQK